MKKILICTLLLALCILGGCQKKPNPDGAKTAKTTASSPKETLPAGTNPAGPSANGVLDCKRSGDTVTVSVTLSECAGQEVSLLALTDRQYQSTWSENPDALSDIGQITLDSQGKGTLTLKLKSADGPACIILTAASGSYISEVN